MNSEIINEILLKITEQLGEQLKVNDHNQETFLTLMVRIANLERKLTELETQNKNRTGEF